MGGVTSSNKLNVHELNGENLGYWVGPYGVLVPNNIGSVVASDGGNTRYKTGGETEMCVYLDPPMNETIYKEKYATFKDGNYYYDIDKELTDNNIEISNIIVDNENNNDGFWIGPYGVLIPNSIDSVVASDGGNTRFKTGGETEMGIFRDPPMNETIYKEKYAILDDNGKYYYKISRVNNNSKGYIGRGQLE